jgi:hypothetical protein
MHPNSLGVNSPGSTAGSYNRSAPVKGDGLQLAPGVTLHPFFSSQPAPDAPSTLGLVARWFGRDMQDGGDTVWNFLRPREAARSGPIALAPTAVPAAQILGASSDAELKAHIERRAAEYDAAHLGDEPLFDVNALITGKVRPMWAGIGRSGQEISASGEPIGGGGGIRIEPGGPNDQLLNTRGNETSDSAALGALADTSPDVRQAWLLSPEEILREGGCLVASTGPISCGGEGGGGSGSGGRGDRRSRGCAIGTRVPASRRRSRSSNSSDWRRPKGSANRVRIDKAVFMASGGRYKSGPLLAFSVSRHADRAGPYRLRWIPNGTAPSVPLANGGSNAFVEHLADDQN